MAILAASTTEPSIPLRKRSDLVTLGPLSDFAPRFHRIVSSVSLVLFVRTYFTAGALVLHLLLASRIVTVQTFLLSRSLALQAVGGTRWLVRRVWNSKSIKRLRKKLVFEFFVLVLGPGGNTLFLMIFWPGWLILAPTVWAICSWFV